MRKFLARDGGIVSRKPWQLIFIAINTANFLLRCNLLIFF